MKRSRSPLKFSLLGGALGFLAPFLLLATLYIGLPGDAPSYIALALAFMEIIPVFIARLLSLPIENGGVAFILYDLNPFGYALVSLFWMAIGSVSGYFFGLIRKPASAQSYPI